MTSTPSLRDLYNPPSAPWSFIPPSPGPPASSSSDSLGPSYQWSARSRPNPTFDLSHLHTGEPSSINLRPVLRSFMTSALQRYSSTAVAMPLEVGELLLQIQWVPRDVAATQPEVEEEAEAEVQSVGTSIHTVDFVSTCTSSATTAMMNLISSTLGLAPLSSIRLQSLWTITDTSFEPLSWMRVRVQSILYQSAVSEVLGRWPTASSASVEKDGYHLGRVLVFTDVTFLVLTLTTGLLTACFHDALLANIQPFVDGCLTSCFLSSSQGFYRLPLWLPVISRVVTGFVLSPLDLVRTRLIAQSSTPRHRTYNGPIHALSEILSQEGGVMGVYFHPHLFIPSVLDIGLRAFAQLVLPSLIAPRLGFGPHVAADTHPVAWSLAEVIGECLGLLAMVPMQTIRRRLQVQVRGAAKPVRTCVETRPVAYNGVVDALWHILTEERSDLPIQRKKRSKKAVEKEKPEGEDPEAEEGKESWLRHTGIGQLYRGLGTNLAAAVLVGVASVLGGREEVDSDWVEL